MRKIYIIEFSFLILSCVCICSGANWQTVTTFNGPEGQTTSYFAIPTKEWRIVWSITPRADYPQSAVFGAFVYPKGEAAVYVEYISATSDEGSGTTYIHQGAKEYYIKIIAANLDNYSLIIEYETTSVTPTTPSGGNTAGSNALLGAVALIIIIGVVVLLILIFRKRGKKTQVIQYSQSQTATPPPPPPTAVSQANLGGDVKTRLTKLKELLDKNLISKEEYEKKKAEILSQV